MLYRENAEFRNFVSLIFDRQSIYEIIISKKCVKAIVMFGFKAIGNAFQDCTPNSLEALIKSKQTNVDIEGFIYEKYRIILSKRASSFIYDFQ